jgi:hypothetical protein
MVAVKVNTFGGMIPAIDDRLLSDQQAAYSENAWLYSGALNGLPVPTLLHEAAAGTAKVYRIPNDYTNSRYLFDSFFMEFENADTDVIRAPVFDDTFDRYYWADSSDDPKYNTKARITNGDAEWLLGIPTPSTGLTATPSGGVGAASVRSYVYTWVSAYGEEGPPSPPVTQTGKVDDTWALASIDAPAGTDDGGVGDDRYIATKRIYRTVTSGSGVATYFFVAEIAYNTTTYNDTRTDADISAEDQLQSTDWTAPPDDLQGFVVMPNGIVASWRSNELWFSEPYRPHAWPVRYVLTVAYPIVGLGLVNQTLVVCTQGFPVTATGVHPSVMTTSNLTSFEPCISRGSILSAPEGVYYASPNGLILVSPGRIENISKDLVTKDRWQQLTSNTNLRAARIGTAYYAFGSVRPGVFDEDAFDEDAFAQEDFTGAYLGVMIDPTNARVAYNVLTSDIPVSNVINDPWSGELFVIKEDEVLWIDQGTEGAAIEAYLWRSKAFQPGDKKNFSALKVYFDDTADDPPDSFGTVRIYADNTLRLERELVASGNLIRLPSGFKADFWQFEIEAYVKVYSVQMATSVKELASV